MTNYLLIPFLPLAAFVINIVFGRGIIKDKAHWISIAAVAGSWVVSVLTLIDVVSGKTLNHDLYSWIVAGNFKVSVGFLIDQLTTVMLIVVTTCSMLIHIYSVGYMHGDKGYYRFFSYLSLFTFCMLMLVMANNFMQLYFGWEGVGLCSYFLIGCGKEGIHRQQVRRLRLRSGHHPDIPHIRHRVLRAGLQPCR
jgi:NADH-quinone oxidoreductase subunit L